MAPPSCHRPDQGADRDPSLAAPAGSLDPDGGHWRPGSRRPWSPAVDSNATLTALWTTLEQASRRSRA